MKSLIVILLNTFLISPAFAGGKECDWAIQVGKDVPYRVNNANGQINLLNSLIAQSNNTLARELEPQYKELLHTLSVYDFKAQTSVTAQAVVTEAIGLLQTSIAHNKKVKATLDRLAKTGTLFPDEFLSKQLRSNIDRVKMDPSTRTTLQQLINSVQLLETARSDWKESEKQIVSDSVNGISSLADSLIEKLRALNDQLSSDLKQLQQSQSDDQKRADGLAKGISDVKGKIAEHQQNITNNQKFIADQLAYQAHWAVDKWCPRYESPRIGMGSEAF